MAGMCVADVEGHNSLCFHHAELNYYLTATNLQNFYHIPVKRRLKKYNRRKNRAVRLKTVLHSSRFRSVAHASQRGIVGHA